MRVRYILSFIITLCLILSVFMMASVALSPEAQATPTGMLKIAMPGLEDETFFPWNGASGRKFYLDTIYEYLFYIDLDNWGDLLPGLALSATMENSGKKWTFKLRKGVQWHGGMGEFTSADVKYTCERIMEPKSMGIAKSQLSNYLESIETPDPYTVLFNLKKPDYFWNYKFSNGGSTFMVCKKYISDNGDDKADAAPVGTGPYTLDTHRRGTSIQVEIIKDAKHYWRVTPQFKSILFLDAPEESTRVAMLKTGEVDLAAISSDSVDTVKSSNLNIISIKNAWAPVIRIGGLVQTDPKRYNPDAPWADKRVRQALNYAVDKASIVRNIFKGEANANYEPHSYATLDQPLYPYNPEKAKQLLKDAGYPDGFKLSLYTCARNPGAELPTIGLAVATYWEAIGIDVKVVPTDYPTIRAAWTGGSGKANNMLWTHTTRIPEALSDPNMFIVAHHSSNVFALFTTPELEATTEKVMAEPDADKRLAVIKETWKYLDDEAYNIWICTASEPYGASKKIGSWPTIPFYPTNFDQVTKQ